MAFLTGLLGRARAAFDPNRLAVSQALLAGDHDAAAEMTQRLRRRRAEHEGVRMAQRRKGVRHRVPDASEVDEMAFEPAFGLELAASTASDRQAPHALPPVYGDGEPFRGLGPYSADRAHEPQHFLDPAAGMDMEPGAAGPPSPWDRRLDQLGSAAPFGNADIENSGFEHSRGMMLPVSAHSGFQQGGRSAPRSGDSRPPIDWSRARGRARVGVGASGRSESIVDTMVDDVVRHVGNVQQRVNRAAAQARIEDRAHRLGRLSAPYESGGEGPHAISDGIGDPGGQSYGTWQLNQAMVRSFVNSDDARRWSREFQDLTPATPQFNAAWRRVAAREPDAFEDAQYAFIRREHYESLARRVRRSTGLDVDGLGDTVRNVVWSTSVQQGWDARLSTFVRAAGAADRQFGRDDPQYAEALIREVYRERISHALQRSRFHKENREFREARMLENIARRRLPQEMSDALRMYQAERGVR